MAPTHTDFEEELRITDVVLEKYTLATLTIKYIGIKLHKDEYKNGSKHAQLMVDDLVFPFSRTPVMNADVCDAKILYNEECGTKDFMELTINYPDDCNCRYSPGDAIGIIVTNTKDDVDTVLNSLNLLNEAENLCEVFVLPNTTKKNAKVPEYIPLQTSSRTIIRDCLELRSVPKKLFLRSLVEYTSDHIERTFLASISSKEGTKLYTELILEKGRTFLDILKLCPSCCPPLSLLIEHLPRLRPRPYSIANSPLVKERKIKFIFSVLKKNPGVATSSLKAIVEAFQGNHKNPQPARIHFYFRSSNKFVYDEEDAKSDSILIGIGCGVSPFLSFLEHKDFLIKEKQKQLGTTWLFVGSKCKASAVYRDQLLYYKEKGVLQELHESFSRDTDCVQFKYVQDQIKERAEMFVKQFIKEDTVLYICADGNEISKTIEICIKECLIDVLQCSTKEAEALIKDSRIKGKYREDLWI